MVRGFVVGVVAVLFLAGGNAGVSAAPERPEDHIVVLHDHVDSEAVAADHSRRHGAQVRFVYRHALRGYAAAIPANRLEAVRSDPRVDYVERDGVATIVVQTLPWGVDRVEADMSTTAAGGEVPNVHVYVIDTGVDRNHPDLYVVDHVNFASGPNKDCHGHGTHVAGTASARDNTADVVGVAPGSPIVGVKVLGCSGSGSWSGVIKGIDWVTANAVKPAVANMSLGGGASKTVDDAVKKSADSGVTYAVAAGNDGADACSYSPARAGTYGGVVTVAATDQVDAETSWSNYGPCVDLWAPGAAILSTRNGGGTTTMSGTSMASPHVAGGAALYLSSNTAATAADVEAALKAAAALPGTTSKDGRSIVLENVQLF